MSDPTIQEIIDAKTPVDVFGLFEEDEQLFKVRGAYRVLARVVHPDVNDSEDAERAFKRLGQLMEAAEKQIAEGTYGTPGAAAVDPVVVTTKRHVYNMGGIVATGDISQVYAGEYEDENGDKQDILLKVAKNPSFNNLIAQEAKVVKHLLSQAETYDVLSPYLPSYIETFGYKSPVSRQRSQASVYKRIPRLFTLEQVKKYYEGTQSIDARDIAWIFRRLLYSLSLVHYNGVVHGAILPPHVLIQPDQHGVVLCDWTNASMLGDKDEYPPIRTISSQYKAWYPDEVLAKETPMAGTDIYMAVRCMVYLLGGDPTTGEIPSRVPPPIRAFFKGCTQKSVRRRPRDAMSLLEEFNELIEQMWGPRVFRPFYMPQ